jgi:hypothetical protein
MPKFLIERIIPEAGKLSDKELQAIAQKSVGVLCDLGTDIRWQQSFVTTDRIYCVYIADNEALVREHARRGGFPADHIERVMTVIDPSTAEG